MESRGASRADARATPRSHNRWTKLNHRRRGNMIATRLRRSILPPRRALGGPSRWPENVRRKIDGPRRIFRTPAKASGNVVSCFAMQRRRPNLVRRPHDPHRRTGRSRLLMTSGTVASRPSHRSVQRIKAMLRHSTNQIRRFRQQQVRSVARRRMQVVAAARANAPRRQAQTSQRREHDEP